MDKKPLVLEEVNNPAPKGTVFSGTVFIKRKAESIFSDMDFGEAEDIDGEIISIEDEAGNYLYENSNY